MNKIIFFLLPLTLLLSEAPSLPSPPKTPLPTDITPYGAMGLSTVFHIPYIANGSLGIRKTPQNGVVGWDISGNYSTNLMWQYMFLKGFIPLYITPKRAKDSFYVGPCLSVGQMFPKLYGSGLNRVPAFPEMELGVSFGKSFGDDRVLAFWQITYRPLSFERGYKYSRLIESYVPTDYHVVSTFPLFRFEYGLTF